jgi:hypothetical protein
VAAASREKLAGHAAVSGLVLLYAMLLLLGIAGAAISSSED